MAKKRVKPTPTLWFLAAIAVLLIVIFFLMQQRPQQAQIPQTVQTQEVTEISVPFAADQLQQLSFEKATVSPLELITPVAEPSGPYRLYIEVRSVLLLENIFVAAKDRIAEGSYVFSVRTAVNDTWKVTVILKKYTDGSLGQVSKDCYLLGWLQGQISATEKTFC